MQAKYEDRLLFLKQFTKELILKSKPPEYEIEKEKLEQTYYGEFIPSALIGEETKPEFLKRTERRLIQASQTPMSKHKIRLAVTTPGVMSFTRPVRPIFRPMQPQLTQQIIPQIQPQPYFEQIDLEKLSVFIQDPRVTVVECPGPEKFILAKTAGQVAVTRTLLTKEEIQNIINKFSEKSRIPIIPGLFKAAVGNLIITAVISDLIGSRFIITKMIPRFIMEQGRIQ